MDNKFRFTNEQCPVCNNTFKVDDDIAVCPECGTPHHRECYKKNINCANHEKHNENFRWEPDFVTPEETEKPKQEPEKQPFLSTEPLPLFSMQIDNIPSLLNGKFQDFDDNIKAEEVALFVRQDSEKYVSKFHKIKNGNSTWNWAAFIFAPYWFFYRKLHKFGVIFLALSLLLSVGFSLLPPVQRLYSDLTEWSTKYSVENLNKMSEEEIMTASNESLALMRENNTGVLLVFSQMALSLGLQFLAGVMGNKWYCNYALKKVKQIKEKEKDERNLKLLLLQQGGTSVGSFFLAVFANNMIVMAIEMLLMTVETLFTNIK